MGVGVAVVAVAVVVVVAGHLRVGHVHSLAFGHLRQTFDQLALLARRQVAPDDGHLLAAAARAPVIASTSAAAASSGASSRRGVAAAVAGDGGALGRGADGDGGGGGVQRLGASGLGRGGPRGCGSGFLLTGRVVAVAATRAVVVVVVVVTLRFQGVALHGQYDASARPSSSTSSTSSSSHRHRRSVVNAAKPVDARSGPEPFRTVRGRCSGGPTSHELAHAAEALLGLRHRLVDEGAREVVHPPGAPRPRDGDGAHARRQQVGHQRVGRGRAAAAAAALPVGVVVRAASCRPAAALRGLREGRPSAGGHLKRQRGVCGPLLLLLLPLEVLEVGTVVGRGQLRG